MDFAFPFCLFEGDGEVRSAMRFDLGGDKVSPRVSF